jgi:uncharacterized protein (DUF2225 family)|tara:strand:- start:7542 stop:7676 length:135 start_codon:yes stop_codon:yes gene_type:complete
MMLVRQYGFADVAGDFSFYFGEKEAMSLLRIAWIFPINKVGPML